MDIVAYDEAGGATPLTLDAAARAAADEHGHGFVLAVVDDPTPDEIAAVRTAFKVPDPAPGPHRTRSRPSLAVIDDHLLLSLWTAHYDDDDEAVDTGKITIWTGPRLVVVMRHGRAREVCPDAAAFGRRPDLLRVGPLAAVLTVVDAVVDAYVPVAEAVDVDIEEVEAVVFSASRTNAAERIYRLKSETVGFHRVVQGLAAALERLLERDLVIGELQPRFAAVRDHLDRVSDRVTGQRELLTSILDAHLAQLSVRQNDDMRRISAWVAIGAIPTVVGAIYGMNFRHMPELGWRLGYPGVLLVIAIACAVLYRAFRRSGWL